MSSTTDAPPSASSLPEDQVTIADDRSAQQEGSTEREKRLELNRFESAIPEDKRTEARENKEDDWDLDPRNPRNWSWGKKWQMAAIVSMYTFVSPLGSSMMAPALPNIADHFGIHSDVVVGLTLSIFLLSFALGPLIIAPLSEIYGRTWVLHISNLLFVAFNLGCAFAPNTGTLVGMRLLAGFAGSTPVAIGGGSVSDLFSENERGTAMAVYTLGPLMGPVVGPIAGGFVVQTIGIKWIFIIISALAASVSAFGIPLLRETYAPVIRLRIAKKSADPEAAAARHPQLQASHANKGHVLWVNLTRPFLLLTRSTICLLLSAYMGLNYGIYYLMFTTFPTLFEQTYGFSPGISGLAYLGLGLGFFLATILGGPIGTSIYVKLAEKRGGKGTPEMRLPLLILGSFVVPIGVFWYGWSAQAKIHWIMPIIGTGIFGFGLMLTFLPISLYLVDTFVYAASALSAAAFIRSMFGFIFPLFAQEMFDALGDGGGNSLLAGLAIAFGIPFPLFLYFRGEQLRERSSLTRR